MSVRDELKSAIERGPGVEAWARVCELVDRAEEAGDLSDALLATCREWLEAWGEWRRLAPDRWQARLLDGEDIAQLELATKLGFAYAYDEDGELLRSDSGTPQYHSNTGINADGAKLLADSPRVRFVRVLDLEDNIGVRDEGMEAIAGSENLANLRELNAAETGLGRSGVIALAKSSTLGELRCLDLSRNGGAASRALASALEDDWFCLDKLRELRLSSNNADVDVLRQLSNSESVGELRVLDLSLNLFGPDGAYWLADLHYGCPNLAELYLTETIYGADERECFFRSKTMRNVEKIVLQLNELDDHDAEAIAGSEHVQNLRVLDLRYNSITAAGVRALAHSDNLAALEDFRIKAQDIGEAGARAIVDSPTLGEAVREQWEGILREMKDGE